MAFTSTATSRVENSPKVLSCKLKVSPLLVFKTYHSTNRSKLEREGDTKMVQNKLQLCQLLGLFGHAGYYCTSTINKARALWKAQMIFRSGTAFL
jgi:hypothetical protein